MILYIVRHGIPDYAHDCLTDEGKKQAIAVGKRLATLKIDEIYSSPLGRARMTAAPLSEMLKLDIKIENWMSESLAWEAFYDDEIKSWAFRKSEIMIGNNDCYTDSNSFGKGYYSRDKKAKQNYKIICDSSDDLLKRLGYEKTYNGNEYKAISPNNKKIAVFCHQGFGLHWISHLLNLPPHIITASFDITHTGVTVFEFKVNSKGLAYPKCLCLSDMSHLYSEGKNLKYHNEFDI